MPVGPSRNQWLQYQRDAAVNGQPPGGGEFRSVDPNSPLAGGQPTPEQLEQMRRRAIQTDYQGPGSPGYQMPGSGYGDYSQFAKQTSNPYTEWQQKWAGRALNPAAQRAMMAELQNLRAVYGSQWNNWEAAANAYKTVIDNGQRRQFRTLDEYNRWQDAKRAESEQRSKLASAQYEAERNRAQQSSAAANMRQQMLSEQGRQATRDRAAGYRERDRWDQLMQMLQMLMGGGGNQITPPSMGGFNSGQYNMRPPAGEIL